MKKLRIGVIGLGRLGYHRNRCELRVRAALTAVSDPFRKH